MKSNEDFFVPLEEEDTTVTNDSVYAKGLMERYSINENEFTDVWDRYEERLYREGGEHLTEGD